MAFWRGVGVGMQSALGSALTISGITKADPGVATSTAHGLTNGDIVLLEVQGMWQVNKRVVRVANVATDTFELEGIDTTDFDTFSSGTAKEITFGHTATTMVNVTATGGEATQVETDTIHDNVESQAPVSFAPSSWEFDSKWDLSDSALVAMRAASDSFGERAFALTFKSGETYYIYGYVGTTLAPTGEKGGLVRTPVRVTAQGLGTGYAS